MIQKSLLVFIDVESLQKSEQLENGFSEFLSLVDSSGVKILDSLKFKQKIPVANNFISEGHLEKIKNMKNFRQQNRWKNINEKIIQTINEN